MSKLLRQGIKLDVREGPAGEPTVFRYKGKLQKVKHLGKRWKMTEGWWRQEIAREYFQVETERGLICEIYRDLISGEWYLQRIYD